MSATPSTPPSGSEALLRFKLSLLLDSWREICADLEADAKRDDADGFTMTAKIGRVSMAGITACINGVEAAMKEGFQP